MIIEVSQVKRTIALWVIIVVDAWIYLAHPRLVWQFRKKTGGWPRAGCPRSYHEKMLWRRLFDRNPLFVTMCDKLTAKDHARSHSADVRIPRTLWQGARPEDIPAGLLEGRVMVKANHGCKFNRHIFEDNDRSALEADANRWLRTTYGTRNCQWGYAGVARKIFVEEMLLSGGEPVRKELKCHVFGGRVYLCNLIIDRSFAPRSCAFDRDGNRIGSIGKFPDAGDEPLPSCYADAVVVVEELCQDIDYVRCDMYLQGAVVYFGEFTVYPDAGFVKFRSSEIMAAMARRWELRTSWFLTARQAGVRRVYAWALRRRLARARAR